VTRYAEKTQVSSAKSKAEIEDTLMRYGATGFMSGVTADKAVIAFEARGRRIKFVLPLPGRDEFEYRTHPRWRTPVLMSEGHQEAAYDQAVRQKWRALALCIKAKLEAVESGIETFEDAFMAHIVLPNGLTMSEFAAPQIAASYQSGTMPPLLGHDA
jgi:hypothetical protein